MVDGTDHDRIISIEGKIDSLRELMETRIKTIIDNTKLAAEGVDKRLDGMNEFRDALKDQASRFITRSEHDQLLKEIQELKETRAMLAGKASQSSVTVTLLIGLGGLMVGIAALIMSVVG